MDTQRDEFLKFVREVEQRARRVVGHAGAGHTQQAAILAAELVQFYMDTRHQREMRKEVAAGDYNLSALCVDVTANSSETPFEDE